MFRALFSHSGFTTRLRPTNKMAELPSAHKKPRKESEFHDENSSSSSSSTSSSNTTSQGSTFTENSPSTDQSSDFDQLKKRDSDLPNNLSSWERKHLEKLNFQISFVGLTPIQLISKNQDDLAEFEKKLLKIKLDLIEKSDFTRFLDSLEYMYTSFDNFRVDKPSPENVCRWDLYLDDKYSFAPKGVPEDLKFWFSRFDAFSKEFAHRLYKILKRKEEKRPIYESHFQFLFSSFVSAFGMLCGTSFAPCLDNEMLTIGNCEVVGVPDIVFSCNSLDSKKNGNRVVVVCEVKKDSPQLEEKTISPPSSKTRGRTNQKRSHEAEVVTSSTTKPDSNVQTCNLKMSDKLIGQHGGELLFNFQNSFRPNIIMGMIVQQTKVSFSVLDMTQNTFEGIVNGKWRHQQEDRPVLTITKPYDLLKKEDRKQLIEPFIKFAVFQTR